MENKYLYPLLGITFGWFLKELSTAFQASKDTKKRLGRAISSLAFINREMKIIQRQFEFFKDLASSHQEYERFRQYTLTKYLRHDDTFVKTIQESISIIAEIAPFKALLLEGIVNSYWFLQDLKLTESSKDYEFYIHQLSSIEVGFEENQKKLEKELRKLIFPRKNGQQFRPLL